jgi:hypothetical protein
MDSLPPTNGARMRSLWSKDIHNKIAENVKAERMTNCLGWDCPLPRKSVRNSSWHPLMVCNYFELRNIGQAFGNPNVHLGNLRNDIQPYFRHITDVPGVQPVLRAASRSLTEEVILPYWHALLSRKLEHLPESADFGGAVYKISWMAGPMTENEKEWTKIACLMPLAI